MTSKHTNFSHQSVTHGFYFYYKPFLLMKLFKELRIS